MGAGDDWYMWVTGRRKDKWGQVGWAKLGDCGCMGRHVSGEGDERVWSPVHVGSVCSAQVSCKPKATEKMRPIFTKSIKGLVII